MTQTILLGDIVKIKGGKRLPKGEVLQDVKNTHPYLRIVDMGEKFINKAALQYVSDDVFPKISRYITNTDDILLSIVGTIGLVSIVDEVLDNASLTENCVKLTCDQDKVDPNFLYYFLTSSTGQDEVRAGRVGSTQPKLPLYNIAKIRIPCLALETQKKIADVLGTIDEKIELNRRMNETLEQVGQALFRHYFIDNPEAEKWEDIPVGDLIESALGGDWGKEDPDEKHTQRVRVIRGTDMDGIKNGNVVNVPVRFVDEKKYLNRQLRVGDILIEISGGSNTQSTGRSLYIDQTTLDLLGGSVIPASFCRVIRARSLKKASVLFTFLEHLYDIGAMWDYQNRSTGISNFQYKFFIENAQIRNVPSNIEEDFYDKVQPLITQRVQNAQQTQTLTTLRDTLLPRLISGKVKV